MVQLPQLLPEQVVALQDSLLANADRLLKSSLAILDLGNIGLARSLAILGLEESGKAIAIHQRRVEIAFEPEGVAFINDSLTKVWGSHKSKLRIVHSFLVEEEYWFDTQPPNPDDNHAALGEIERWADQSNVDKQRGFYVDIDQDGNALQPEVDSDSDSDRLRQIISQVHQIGWQLRLGEHIVAKQQEASTAHIPPAAEAEVASMKEQLEESGMEREKIESIVDRMRQGRKKGVLNNDGYRLHLPSPGSSPLRNLGRAGYEAETRELLLLADMTEQEGEDNASEQS